MIADSSSAPAPAVEEALEQLRAGKTDLATLCALSEADMEAAHQRGTQLLQAGFNTQALHALEALVLLRPNEARFVRTLAFAYQRSNQPKKAYQAFSRAHVLAPLDGIAHLMRAECALFAVGPEEGIEQLKQAIEQAPRTPQTHPYHVRAKRLLALASSKGAPAGAQSSGDK